jgi:hypothetical protein
MRNSLEGGLDGGIDGFRGRVRVAGAFLGILLLAASVDDAAAARRPPPGPPAGASAVDVYRESIPTSAGPDFPGSQVRHVVALPRSIDVRVRRRAGKSAGLLERVATSTDLGAPLARSPHAAPAREAIGDGIGGGWAPRGLVAAVVDTLDGSLGLPLVFGIAVAAIGTALLLKQRRSGA